jgi:hypothetical protein
VGNEGYEIEAIVLDGRDILRVRKHGYFIADCHSVDDIRRCGIHRADLAEVIPFPPRPRPTP